MGLKFWLIEPSIINKRVNVVKERFRKASELDLSEIKARLKKIRENSVNNIYYLLKKLRMNLEPIQIKEAKDAKDAAGYILKVAGDIKNIVINKSSTVNEIISKLRKNGFQVIDTYQKELIGEKEKPIPTKIKSYWQLPEFPPAVIWSSFSAEFVERKNFRQKKMVASNLIGVLGVNAVSGGGDIYFLQHFENISKILEEVEKIVLLVGIDKIVRNKEDAEFQTRCCGLFGFDNLLCDIFSSETMKRVERILKIQQTSNREPKKEIHLILFDNGRSAIYKSKLKELLYCISCKACSRLCPRAQKFRDEIFRSPKELAFSFYAEGVEYAFEHGLYDCTTCGYCQSSCPLELPIPEFILKLRELGQKKGYIPTVHERIYTNTKQFGNPYGKE